MRGCGFPGTVWGGGGYGFASPPPPPARLPGLQGARSEAAGGGAGLERVRVVRTSSQLPDLSVSVWPVSLPVPVRWKSEKDSGIKLRLRG